MVRDSLVEQTLRQLSLEEKCLLLSGKNMWETNNIDRLCIPSLKTTDGPAGVRGSKWTDGSHTTYIPCGISLGASFDPDLIERVGRVLGLETKSKQAHVLLAPTMNISRSPFGGRNFENFGEDPFLTGAMAASYIRGVQSQGVGACMKHFVANDMETRRFNMDQTIDQRTLREIYLKPFKIALKADPWAVMTSYPKINGEHADTSRHLVTDILRTEWGCDRLAMSDWGGLNETIKSIHAGTDLEMPGPPLRYGKALATAVEAGQVSETEHIDPSVRRVLELLHRTGLLTRENKRNLSPPNFLSKSIATSSDMNADPSRVHDGEKKTDLPEFRQIARDAATSSIVLLKNHKNILPLRDVQKIAIIGPNAKTPTAGGTGSAIVNPYYITTPYESITKEAQRISRNVQVVHERGILTHLQPPLMGSQLKTPDGEATGFQVDFYHGHEFTGEIVATTFWQNSLVYLMSDGDTPEILKEKQFCYRASGVLTVPVSGQYKFSLSNTGKAILFVNDEPLIDNREWTQISGNFMNCGSVECFAKKCLDAVQTYRIRVDNLAVPPSTRPHDNTLFYRISGVRVGMLIEHNEEAMFEAAVAAAKAADVAVVVVGHNNDTEREGSDRVSLHLPGRTNELISTVAAANKNTVIVCQTACAVAMPWVDDVAAVVQAWYQGQENGNAIADVLFGRVNPSGKLPITFPHRIEDHGSHQWFPGDAQHDRAVFGEGVLVGYRWFDAQNTQPLWPFGFGLSYTSFQIRNVRLDGFISADGAHMATIEANVTNTGSVDGKEVVQVYTSPSPLLLQRDLPVAPKSLAAFRKINVKAGETKSVQLRIDRDSISWFDVSLKEFGTYGGAWRVDLGLYRCLVGTSSRNIVAELDLLVKE